jgi:hypothetical protein
MIASVLGVVAVAVVALTISFASGGRTTGNGCVDVTVQYVTGGTEIYQCGAEARSLCASVRTTFGNNGVLGRAVASECSKAGLPTSR